MYLFKKKPNTFNHVLSGFLLQVRCKIICNSKILLNKDVGSKVQHVLFAASVRHLEQGI